MPWSSWIVVLGGWSSIQFHGFFKKTYIAHDVSIPMGWMAIDHIARVVE